MSLIHIFIFIIIYIIGIIKIIIMAGINIIMNIIYTPIIHISIKLIHIIIFWILNFQLQIVLQNSSVWTARSVRAVLRLPFVSDSRL